MYRLRCFGTMALEDGGDADLTLRSRKHWALLVYLLAHRGRAFPRERLARLFWDTEPRLARHSLSQALYDIRTTLPGVEFDSSTSQVGAGAEDLAYDGEAFEEAVRSDDLSRAVRLYGGRFAPDVEDAGNSDFTRWLESERQRYRRLAEMALYRHVRESQDRADWGEMCVSAVRLLDMNPLSEDAHRALMRGLWLQGDRAAAVRHFEDYEDFLQRELPGGLGRETLDLVERIRANDRTLAPVPDDAGRQRMVGRQEEFAVLRRRLEELREEARGGLVRVHGEAGMGKTRLLEEFRSLVELDGVRLLESRCYAAESDVPYGPVVEALDGLAREAAAADDDGELSYHQLGHLFPEAFDRPSESRDAFAEPDAGRRRLYEEAADLLRRTAERAPLVWLMEDVHWVDPSSASLLHYLVRRLDDTPLLVVVTARTHEDVDGPARELLEDDPESLPDVADVELEPLEHEETTELVTSASDADPLAETVDRIHVLAGGNPFYALELLRASTSMEGDDVREVLDNGTKGLITESLRALLERRLRGLPADAVRIMEAVAVAGRHATAPLVREVTEFPPPRIAELAGALYDRGLLRDVDGRLEFLHDITRDFVYGSLGDLQRSALHLSVGERLEDREGVADPATLARHFRRGGERSRAYRYALKAARDAERRHAHDEAIRMGEMALELAEGDREEAEALWVVGRAEYFALELSSARRHLLQLEKHDSGNIAHIRKQVFLYLASVAINLNKWSEVMKWCEKAQSNSAVSNDDEYRLKILHLKLKASLKASQHKEARAIRNQIRSLVSSRADSLEPRALGALASISLAAYDLYYESAEQTRQRLESVRNVDELPVSMQLTLLQLKGAAEHRTGNFARSRVTHNKSLNVAAEHNDIFGQLTAINNLMCECLESGSLEQSLDYYSSAKDIIDVVPAHSGPFVHMKLNLAETLFGQEKYEQAYDVYQELKDWLDHDVRGESEIAAPINAGLGLTSLAVGDYTAAEHIFTAIPSGQWKVLGGVPAADVVGWFQGFMLWQEDEDQAHQFMIERGEEQLPYQKVAGRRILWLAHLFSHCLSANSTELSDSGLYSSVPAENLREIDNGWFLRFSKRWLAVTLHSRPEIVRPAR